MSDTRTIADLTGDLVIYRNLEPYDPQLPGLAVLRAGLGLPPDTLPRKRDAAYAQVVLAMLHQGQEQRSHPPLCMLLVVGDTNNDRSMARHLRAASGLPVYAFIGTDRTDVAPALAWEDDTATASRWVLLDAWLEQVADRFMSTGRALPWDQAALLLDIDKTLLGPRGRNDGGIDQARAEAALVVARELLGPGLDEAAFQRLYAQLCSSAFHSLTLDNQDYIVYITLLLACGALDEAEFVRLFRSGALDSFSRLLAHVAPHTPPALADLHAEIGRAHDAGDPTPFKAFRRAEFATTVASMADGRLTLCSEVMELAARLTQQGVLALAASDKPAESALPTPEQAATGLLPLHRTPARLG